MKKTIILPIVMCLCISCFLWVDENYRYFQGYIYTREKQPLHNVRVYEPLEKLKGTTDENGYFKIFVVGSIALSQYLIIELEENIIDTLRVSHHPRQRHHSFVEGRADTAFVDMEGKKKTYIGHYYGKRIKSKRK